MNIDVDALKASVDLVSLVGAYTTLRKRGKEYVGLCVAHADNNPSMWVNGDKGIVHCFACDFHADAIDFIRHVEGLDFHAACARLGAKTDWKPRLEQPKPAAKPERITSKPPLEAPTPNMVLRGLGEPSRIWPYKDTDGSLIGYVARYEAPDGKQIRCWSWGQRGDEPHAWGCGAWSKPRPLYGLDRLEARRGAPVLIVEGEKAADAAQEKLGQYVVVTWPGGAKAWKHADYEPLRGRRVDLWPDNDAPGIEAMQSLKAILADPRGLACYGKIIDPNRMPDGYDAADWTGSSAELIDWLRERATEYPEKPAPQEPTEGGEDRREPADAGPPPETAPPAPEDIAAARKRKPRLAVVGNTALAPEEDAAPLPQAMSEDAIADQFADDHAENWRYVRPWNSWFQWRDDGWYKDEAALIDRLAVEKTRQAIYWTEAAGLTHKERRTVNSRKTAGAVRDLTQSDRRIAARIDQWDVNPWLLGVPGGVVDLKTGILGAAARDAYITKRTTCAPAAGEPQLWLSFLRRITGGDESLIEYLQRFAGYGLTGITSEHALAFLYGSGANGKTTFVHTLAGILGDYAVSAGFEVFAESKGADRHPTEIARLRGARLVVTEETDAGGRWNEGRVKRLTGGGKISAHFMRQDDFEFEPQFKLLIAGNHKPVIKAVDEAIKRRIHLIPFTVTIPPDERDKQLLEKLSAEWPQILQWAIDGCMLWQERSLSPGERILAATEQYVEQEDILGAWLEDNCERSGECDGKTLYDNYRRWCEQQGEHAWSRRGWSNAMFERGFDQRRTAGARLFAGVTLKLGANL